MIDANVVYDVIKNNGKGRENRYVGKILGYPHKIHKL